MEKMPTMGAVNQEKNQQEKLFERLGNTLKRLRLMGVMASTMFVAGENLSAQTMQEGTINADSTEYKMSPEQAQKITMLTHDVDSMMHVLKAELQKKGGVSQLNESINDHLISSRKTYDGRNAEVGAPGSFVIDYKGDTAKVGENWMNIGDTMNHVDETVFTRDNYSFEKGKHGTTIDHYTNKTQNKYGGEMVTFTYGETLNENNAIMIERFTEQNPENKHERRSAYAGGNAQDGFSHLEKTLQDIKHKVGEIIQENR